MTRPDRSRVVCRAAVGLTSLGALLALAACDPCAGVPSCRDDARVSYSGRIIDFVSGRGTAGVTVVFRRQSGLALTGDSVVAVTDADGRFQLVADVSGSGEIVGSAVVRPPAPLVPYQVPKVRLSASTVRGAGGVLPTWVSQPVVSFVGALVNRRRGVPVALALAQFVRRSGARLTNDTVRAGVDPSGYFYLQAQAVEAGDVVGDLTLIGGTLERNYVIPNVTLTSSYLDRLPSLNATWQVGSTLSYAFLLLRRGPATPLVGADVEFRRTGGPAIVGGTLTARSDADGRVVLSPTPAGEQSGVVVGDLTVRAPGLARPYVVTGVALPTFDSDELRFGGVVSVGYAAVSAAELTFRGDRSPLAGADVQFVRTGGVAANPATVDASTRSDGRFGIIVTTDTIGEVVGDLLVRPAGAATATRVPGVRLLARGDDSVRFAGRFAVGQQLLYNGVLTLRGSGAPAAGWTVVFRRTGGIGLVTDTLASVAVDWGGFAIDPATRAEGTVEGTLEARSPTGGRTYPLGPIRLQTNADDVVRLAGRWTAGPSLLYVGELRRADTDALIVGALVEFRPTGGIPVAERAVGERTNAEGRFRLAPTPLADGEVVGDLHISPPAPLRDTTIVGVRLRTFESDEVRLGGVWRLTP